MWESLGKPRGHVVTSEVGGVNNTQIKLLSCTRKKSIWQAISAFLWAAGFEDRDKDACKTRIHTLVRAYHSCKDECRTGNGTPKRKPAFFDEVDECQSENPCTKPKVLILPRFSLGMVQRTVKKKAKEVSKTSYQTCLPASVAATAAAIATTSITEVITANARNHKTMLV